MTIWQTNDSVPNSAQFKRKDIWGDIYASENHEQKIRWSAIASWLCNQALFSHLESLSCENLALAQTIFHNISTYKLHKFSDSWPDTDTSSRATTWHPVISWIHQIKRKPSVFLNLLPSSAYQRTNLTWHRLQWCAHWELPRWAFPR